MAGGRDRTDALSRYSLVSGVIVVDRQANLLEIVAATHSPSGFTCSLNGRQEQPHQNANNGDHNQKFTNVKPRLPFERCMEYT